MAVKQTKWPYQQLPLQDPPKFTQSGIFGLKTNHPRNLKFKILIKAVEAKTATQPIRN
jgi:hypothetical protein